MSATIVEKNLGKAFQIAHIQAYVQPVLHAQPLSPLSYQCLLASTLSEAGVFLAKRLDLTCNVTALCLLDIPLLAYHLEIVNDRTDMVLVFLRNFRVLFGNIVSYH